jgi:multidrug efflux pump subunit AcrA (membrane-fusion protein)
MANDLHQPNAVSDPEWLEFESLLSELARLAKSGIPFDRLVKSLLDQTVHILAAVGGAVWLGNSSTSLRLECQVNYEVLNGAPRQNFYQQLLEHALSQGETLVVPPGGTTAGSKTLSNPTNFTLLIGPLSVDEDFVGLIEIIQRPSASAAAMRGNRRLLGLVCELAADHLRRRELRQLRDERLRTTQFEEFIERIHGTLDLRRISYEVANAGRQFIGCDRVSVAVRKGRRFELIAISSVDSINRRSNAVHRLEELASRVAKADESVWYDGENDETVAPQILESLRRFADDVHPRMVGLIPLSASQLNQSGDRASPIGVLIVEQFTSLLEHTARERAARIATHSGLALLNALRYQFLPTLPFARRLTRADGRPVARTSSILAALAGITLIASLFIIPADFNVRAEGELQPHRQQHVFAPFEGQVASLPVQHGDQVKANEILLELRSPELDLESHRIQGEFNTTQQRIASIESSLLQMDVADEPDESRSNQLAAEREELAQLLASQREQLSVLRQQREKLVIRSPMDGRVLTWDLEQLLSDRPVQRGQLLLSIANLNGPWVAELDVPDDQIGYVLSAHKTTDAIQGSFQLATNRGVDYRGEVLRVSSRTESADHDRAIVRVTMDVDEEAIGELRPGATIFAEIHCGQRTVAYVLFHDLFETVQNWIRFY